MKNKVGSDEAVLVVRVRAKDCPVDFEAVFGRSISGFSPKNAASLRL